MKIYKLIECLINSTIISIFIVLVYSGREDWVYIYSYIGGPLVFLIQLFNVIAQHASGWFKNAVRSIFQYITYGLIIVLLLNYPALSIIMPFLFVSYTCLCLYELFFYKKSN